MRKLSINTSNDIDIIVNSTFFVFNVNEMFISYFVHELFFDFFIIRFVQNFSFLSNDFDNFRIRCRM